MMTELMVEHCQTQVHLNSVLTNDGSVSTTVIAHSNAKMLHTLLFVSFINKNNNNKNNFESSMKNLVLETKGFSHYENLGLQSLKPTSVLSYLFST